MEPPGAGDVLTPPRPGAGAGDSGASQGVCQSPSATAGDEPRTPPDPCSARGRRAVWETAQWQPLLGTSATTAGTSLAIGTMPRGEAGDHGITES